MTKSPRTIDKLVALAVLLPGLGAFVVAWRYVDFEFPVAREDAGSPQCRDNLRKISEAVALYAQDYDGHFPRGTNPTDTINKAWKTYKRGRYWETLKTAPTVQRLLMCYLPVREVWHCPAERPYSMDPTENSYSAERTVAYSFAGQGTSYYYRSIHGMAVLRVSEIIGPSTDPLFFDDASWHNAEKQKRVNCLFADGHVENLSWDDVMFMRRKTHYILD